MSSFICSFFQLILIQIFEFFVYLFDCQVSCGSTLFRLSIASPSRDDQTIKLNATRASPAGASRLVGLDGLEPSTSRLSGARSSHLSYRPFYSKAYSVRSTVPCRWDSNLLLELRSRDWFRLTIVDSNFRFAVLAPRTENWWR